MKKFSFFLFLSISLSLAGQNPIPNGNFENWIITQFLELDDYITPARESQAFFGTPATLRSGDRVSGNYSVRMETFATATDTVFGFITTGEFGLSNGFAFTQQPDSIVGYYKCDIMPGDTAILILNFSTLGNQFSSVTHTFVGVQNSWQKFSFPLNVSQIPDSAFVGAASSNGINNVGIQNGSWLMLDSIAFKGVGIVQTIPNFDFENWTADSSLSLDFWSESEAASRTTDNQEGIYALKLETTVSGGDTAFVITNGKILNGSISGGYPFTNMLDTLVGKFKYLPVNNDTAAMGLNFIKNGVVFEQKFQVFTPQMTYTNFEIPFNLSQTPDSMYVVIGSSVLQTRIPGSALFIDDLKIKSIITSLNKVIEDVGEIKLYPNPTIDFLNFEVENSKTQIQVQVVDALGRNMTTKQIINGEKQISIDVSKLRSGTYFLRLETNGEFIHRSFIKQ